MIFFYKTTPIVFLLYELLCIWTKLFWKMLRYISGLNVRIRTLHNINMFMTCFALHWSSVPWQGWLADFRARTFVLGWVCLWSKLLIWESFIFMNPMSTESQHRPMALSSPQSREQDVASFVFICDHWRQRGTCSRQFLEAFGFKLGEPFSLSIEISQGNLQALQGYYSVPCLDGLDICPIAVMRIEIS